MEMTAEGRKRIGRLPLLLMSIGCLLVGFWGGLVRLPLNLPLPGGNANWLTFHGPLMVCGFLGTVIGLELSLDEPCSADPESDGPRCLHECLAAHTEDPAMAALRHLDWEQLLASLDPTTRKVLLCLMKGQDLITLVPLLKRSSSALGADKRRLARLVHEQLGADILARVQEQPRWRNNVEASRQKLACRYERQTT